MNSGSHDALTKPLPNPQTEEEQLGGGRRPASPPPEQTPTRLRTKVKATARDTGLVRDAGDRRGRLLEESNTAGAGPQVVLPATDQQLPTRTGTQVEKKSAPTTDSETVPAGSKDAILSTETTSISHNPFRVLSPRRPGPPPLLDLKETLASVQAQKHAGRLTAERGAPPSPSEDPVGAEDISTPRAQNHIAASWPVAPRSPSTFGAFDIDLDDRPGTPTPQSRIANEPNPFLVDDEPPAMTGPVACLGRTPVRVGSILDEEFNEIYTKFSRVSTRVGLPFHHVLNRFTKQFGRTCSSNWWNIYQRFYAANKEQEQARLGECDIVESTPVQSIGRCYALFRGAYPDKWQKILEKFEEGEGQMDGGKTVAQRQSMFHRLMKHHTQAFAGMAKAHGFEILLIGAGSVIHQDASLGLVYTTPGALDFFQLRCRADDNEMLAHFKAHVYNNFSLANPPVVLDPSGTGGIKPAQEAEVDEEVEVVEVANEMEDHACLRSAFVSALTKVGCQWASGKLFPWKALPGRLASSGVVCHNFPDAVPFPGEDRPRSKAGSKGISDLSLAECSLLLGALGNTTRDGLFFERKPKLIGELRAHRLPVIHGAPPEYDSTHKCGKRMFADGTWDRKGLPRRPNVGGTRIKRKKKADCDQITIESDSDRPRVKKIKSQAPIVISISDSDHHEKRTSPLPKRTLPRRNRKGGQATSAMQIEIDESDKEVQDGVSSASGSEFAPEKEQKGNKKPSSDAEEDSTTSEGDPESDAETAGTLKRKRAGKVSAERPAKKRVVKVQVEVPRANALASKDKGKAPARSKTKSRNKVVCSPSSSEDEQQLRGGVPAPRIAPSGAGPSQPAVVTLPSRSASGGQTVPASQVVPVPLESKAVKQQQIAQAAPAAVARPKPRMVTNKVAGLTAETEGIDPFSLRQRKDLVSAAADPIAVPRADSPAVHHASVNPYNTPPANPSANEPASESAVLHASREAVPVSVEEAPPNNVALPAPVKTAEAAAPVRPPQDSAQGPTSHVAPADMVPPQNAALNVLNGHASPQLSGNACAPGWPQGEDPRLQALANALAAQLLRGMPFPFPNVPTNNGSGSG